MSDNERIAKEYLDHVIKTQKALGYKAKVSRDQYDKTLGKLTVAFLGLSSQGVSQPQ